MQLTNCKKTPQRKASERQNDVGSAVLLTAFENKTRVDIDLVDLKAIRCDDIAVKANRFRISITLQESLRILATTASTFTLPTLLDPIFKKYDFSDANKADHAEDCLLDEPRRYQ